MTSTQTLSLRSIQKQAVKITLSVPVQTALYLSTCGLVLWTVYFSSYPAVHNHLHSLRHHTFTVSCH